MIIPINLPQPLTLFDPSINVHGGPPSERYKTTSQDETKQCLKPTGLVCTQEEHNFFAHRKLKLNTGGFISEDEA